MKIQTSFFIFLSAKVFAGSDEKCAKLEDWQEEDCGLRRLDGDYHDGTMDGWINYCQSVGSPCAIFCDASTPQCNSPTRGSTNSAIFAEFGLTAGDTKFDRDCDDCSERVDLSSNYFFFGTWFSNVAFIGSNGVISFEDSYNGYSPQEPSTDDKKFIAPYWADNNLKNGGDIYFREETSNNDWIDGMVWPAVGDSTYRSESSFIVTYYQMVYYGGKCADRFNTFQSILTQGGGKSYWIVNYGDLEWNVGGYEDDDDPCEGTGPNNPAAQAYNFPNGQYFNNNNMINAEQQTNSLDQGQYVFDFGEVPTPNPPITISSPDVLSPVDLIVPCLNDATMVDTMVHHGCWCMTLDVGTKAYMGAPFTYLDEHCLRLATCLRCTNCDTSQNTFDHVSVTGTSVLWQGNNMVNSCSVDCTHPDPCAQSKCECYKTWVKDAANDLNEYGYDVSFDNMDKEDDCDPRRRFFAPFC